MKLEEIPRCYTVKEIENMRRAVRTLAKFGRHYQHQTRLRTIDTEPSDIEDQLRTYMLNNTAPEELMLEAEEVLKLYKVERDAREQYTGKGKFIL